MSPEQERAARLWALVDDYHLQVRVFRNVASEASGCTRWSAERRAEDWQKAADMLGQRLFVLGIMREAGR